MLNILRHYIPATIVVAAVFVLNGPADVLAAYVGRAIGAAVITAVVGGIAAALGAIYAPADVRQKRAEEWTVVVLWVFAGLAVLGFIGGRMVAGGGQ